MFELFRECDPEKVAQYVAALRDPANKQTFIGGCFDAHTGGCCFIGQAIRTFTGVDKVFMSPDWQPFWRLLGAPHVTDSGWWITDLNDGDKMTFSQFADKIEEALNG